MTKFTTDKMVRIMEEHWSPIYAPVKEFGGEWDDQWDAEVADAIIARLKAADELVGAAKDVANTHLGIEEWLNQMEMLRKAIKGYEEA